ncbi:MAG: hypothetical protein V1904_01475, partial [Bacteroidota bacterium]
MRKTIKILAIIFAINFFWNFHNEIYAQGGTSINTTGAAADNSAMLDITSTDKGLLIPRMTSFQKFAIAFPATGLLIYQTDGAFGFWYFDGTVWLPLTGIAGPTGPTGANGTNGINGVTGPQGPAGTNGIDGATGTQGPAGPTGVASTVPGPTGSAGANGTNGIDGT